MIPVRRNPIVQLFVNFTHIISWLLFRKTSDMAPKSFNSLLIIVPCHLGDAVLASWFIRWCIAQNFKVTVACQPASQSVLKSLLPSIDYCNFRHPYHVRNQTAFLSKLRTYLSDLACLRNIIFENSSRPLIISPYYTYPSISLDILFFSGQRVLTFGNNGWRYLNKVNACAFEHSQQDWQLGFRLMELYTGIKLGIHNILESQKQEASNLFLENRLLIRKKIAVLHPGVSTVTRHWTYEGWAELIHKLVYNGWCIAIIDTDSTDVILNSLPDLSDLVNSKRVVLTKTFSIHDFLQVLSHSKVFIGLESFGVHFAASLGLPTVAIYTGISGQERMLPQGNSLIVLRQITSCSPCYSQVCSERQCITSVSPQQVFNAVQELT